VNPWWNHNLPHGEDLLDFERIFEFFLKHIKTHIWDRSVQPICNMRVEQEIQSFGQFLP
jgi:hypothetical protein